MESCVFLQHCQELLNLLDPAPCLVIPRARISAQFCTPVDSLLANPSLVGNDGTDVVNREIVWMS